MDIEYNGVGFFVFVALFFLAGFISRYALWIAILLTTLTATAANYCLDCSTPDILSGGFGGLLAGLSGGIIVPLLWAGRHGRAKGIIFLNNGGTGRHAPYFNWIKTDNHPDNQSNRKRWTEKPKK